MTKLAVVALGGNALLRSGQRGTYEEQLDNVGATVRQLMRLAESGYHLIVGHGNGPQVGNVMLQHAAGSNEFGTPVMPMDFCVAETQGSIGYMLELALRNALRGSGSPRGVVTLVTEVVVEAGDSAFGNPTKPIGPYYTKEQADALAAQDGSQYREDPKGNGWRKVVASPVPTEVMNVDVVERLAREGSVVIAAGGGGIPVWRDGRGELRGIEAVIDKDLASALMAVSAGADEFYILTDVPQVYINFRKADERALDVVTVAEAERYIEEGHFTAGSMLPKVRAALYFVRNGGAACVITDADHLATGGGTRIVP